VVLKPNLSKIYSPTGWVATTVRILKTKEDLNEVLASDAYLKETPFMLQEYIPGHGAGLFCLYNRGEPTHFFAHNRLREKPPEGGVSVLSEAAPLNDSLKNSAVKLLNSVKWHGVAMVEFRVDANGKAYLMEVNTRFWGSLQLAIDSGVNFPVLLAQQFFNETTGSMLAYNTKQRLRWLMGDLDSLYIYLKRPYTVKQKLVRVLQFLKPRFNHQKHEVNRLNDFKPFIYELKHYFR
jgi:predicted ATP-grasp superfamily ATP-dependent carboligase